MKLSKNHIDKLISDEVKKRMDRYISSLDSHLMIKKAYDNRLKKTKSKVTKDIHKLINLMEN